MEMSYTKLKFIFFTTCLLMHFMDSSNGFHLKEAEDTLEDNIMADDMIQLNNNATDDKISINIESATTQDTLSENVNDIATTVQPQITTTIKFALLNEITENVQNITFRKQKSLGNNVTIDSPENSEKIINSQLSELSPAEISQQDEMAPALLVRKPTSRNKNLNQIVSTNFEENSIPISATVTQPNKPELYVEIRPDMTGEELEASLRQATRDEILMETPIDQVALDVLAQMPTDELRESVARDILGKDYIRRAELSAMSADPDTSLRYETLFPQIFHSTESSIKNTEQVAEKKEANENSYIVNVESDSNEQFMNDQMSETTETQSDLANTTEESGSEITTKIPISLSHEAEQQNITTSLSIEMTDATNLKTTQTEREGRAMGLSSSIMDHQSLNDSITPETLKTTTLLSEIVSDSLNTESATQKITLESPKIEDTDKSSEIAQKNESLTKNPSLIEDKNIINETQTENEIFTKVTDAELLHSQISETEILITTTPTLVIKDVTTLTQEQGLGDMSNVTQQSVTTMLPIRIEQDIKQLNSSISSNQFKGSETIKSKPEQTDHLESENIVIPNTEIEKEIIKLNTSEKNENISDAEITSAPGIDKEIVQNIKENLVSNTSESSDSSEEIQEIKNNVTLTIHIKNENESSDSNDTSEESSSESSEKINNKVESKKSSQEGQKPKGRSLSIFRISKLNDSTIETFTLAPEDSNNSEHMIFKKGNAESEDENSVTPIPTTVLTKITTEALNILNPRLKILLPNDETRKIPHLTFETTTLLPLKIFKSHPSEPVKTDDIPNKINFAPRILDSNSESEQQQDDKEIRQILETESSTHLIAETFTEAVELSKEINRNMDLFLEPFETNRTFSTIDIENISASDNEIMAESNVAEALPNQRIRSIESSMNATLVILICVSIIVMIIAVIVVTFFKFRTPQGVLDIEMQEQRNGKDCNVSDDDDRHHHNDHKNNYHCCTRRRTSSSVVDSDDTLSHSASCSLVTTSTSSSSSPSTSTGQCSNSSSFVKRSASDCRSHLSIQSSVSLLAPELIDETTKLKSNQVEEEPTKLIPTETSKLIPKNEDIIEDGDDDKY